jgi:hypothetical protein
VSAEKIYIGGGHEPSEHALVDALRESLRGRSVVDVLDGLPTEDPGWSDHGSITIVFDDGSTLDCGGWGHDAWGPAIQYEPNEAT